MKRFVTILLIGMTHLTYSQNIVELPEQLTDAVDVDTIISHSPYLLKVDVDTLFIINKKGLIQYQNCITDYRSLRLKCGEIQDIIYIIDQVDSHFDTLNSNLLSLENKYEMSLMQNLENNRLLRDQNAAMSKNLEIALDDLAEAKNKIRHERWNSKGMKLLWGAGGVIVGTLVGGALISISR
ncbi:hypothetical protein ACT3CD_00165 [Geofilum sp. OHC36d9]|uniref:hypothetical protein n=1 Tax=Geofilum sp. OHC36d9 TaxID=3458413 RepID=UPI0040337C70